jgi:Uma2 family endonuclease
MLTQEAPPTFMTVEEFITLPQESNRYELVEGKLVETTNITEAHNQLSVIIATHLTNFVESRGLGRVYGVGARYETIPATATHGTTIRIPDVSFLQTARLKRGVINMPYAPDLVAEILTPTIKYIYTETKVREYFQTGAKLFWLVSPRMQCVFIYQAGDSRRYTLDLEDELNGDEVLPGFKLSVKDFFEMPT